MPVSLSEWRVRIGRFIHWFRGYEITERKEKLLKERTRLLKILHERLLGKGSESENDRNECEERETNVSKETASRSGSDEGNVQNDSIVKDNTSKTETTSKKRDRSPESSIEQNNLTDESRNGDSYTKKEPTTKGEKYTPDLIGKENYESSHYDSIDKQNKPSTKPTIREDSTQIKSTTKHKDDKILHTTFFFFFFFLLALFLLFDANFPTLLENSKQVLQLVEINSWISFVVVIVCCYLVYEMLSCIFSIKGEKEVNFVDVWNNQRRDEMNMKGNYYLSDSTVKEKSSMRKSVKEKNKASKSTVYDNNTSTEFSVKEKNTRKKSDQRRKHFQNKRLISENNHEVDYTSTEYCKRNRSAKGKNSIGNKYTTKENDTLTKPSFGENENQYGSTLRRSNASNQSTNKKKNTRNEYFVEKSKTPSGSTVKGNNTPIESTIITENSHRTAPSILTRSTVKEKTTGTEFSMKVIDNGWAKSSISMINNNTRTNYCTKTGKTSSASKTKGRESPPESTTKENHDPGESTCKENITQTQFTIQDNDTLTEFIVNNKNSETKSSFEENKISTSPTFKGENNPKESTVEENTSFNESSSKRCKTPCVPVVKGEKTQRKYATQNTRTEESTAINNNTATDSPVRENNTPNENVKGDIPTQSAIKEKNTRTKSSSKNKNFSIRSTVNRKHTASELTFRVNKTGTESVITKINFQAESITKEKNTPDASSTSTTSAENIVRENITPNKSIIKKNTRCQSTIKQNSTKSELAATETKTQTRSKGSRVPTISINKVKSIHTEFIKKEINTPSESKTKSKIKGKNTQYKSASKENSTSTKTPIKEYNTPTESTIKENSTPTKSPIKENNTPTESTIKENNAPMESTTKETPTKSATKENKTLTESTIKECSTPTKSPIKENSNPMESTIKENNIPTKSLIKENNTPRESIIKENSTLTESNIKENETPTESTIKECSTPTKSPIKEKNTPAESIIEENDTQTKSPIKENSNRMESTIKENNTPTKSLIKENNTPRESTIKENSTLTESNIKENNTPRESIIKENSTLTESNIKENNTPRESIIKKNNTLTESTIKESNTSMEFTTKENSTPTKSETKENETPKEAFIKANSTSRESTIKEKNAPTESTIKDNIKNNAPNESRITENNAPSESRITENNAPTESTITENNAPSESTIKEHNAPTEAFIKENTTSRESIVKENYINSPIEPTINEENAPAESTTKEDNVPTESAIKENNAPTEPTIKANITKSSTGEVNTTTEFIDDYTFRSRNKKIPSRLDTTSEDPILQETACPAEILLVKAGDVELNPGPSDRQGDIQEQELVNLAYDVPPSKYAELCITLGTTYTQSQAILTRHLMDIPGSLIEVFCEWKNRQKDRSDYRQSIAKALSRANLDALGGKMIKGEYLPQETTPSGSSENGKEPLTKEQVARCAKDFQTFYRTRLCKIKTDPLNFTTIKEFEDIYTDLVLLRNKGGTTTKTPLKYHELLITEVNGEFPKRLMVEGEGGAGKTTLCSKIAWDWTNRIDQFREFDWVLFIPLREIETDQTIGEIAKTYLSDGNSVQPCQIDEYLLANPSKVFIIFDGLDEYDGDLVQESSDIAKIIRSEKFRECRVLITTRPWKADQIKSNTNFGRVYAFIAVTGFDKEHISIYINKYFSDDAQAGRELINLIESNDVIKENMAPYPIYIAMLCVLWRDYDSEKRKLIRRLKTFSQLFKEIMTFLKDHYVSKQFADLNKESITRTHEQLGIYFTQIGHVALTGVIDKKLVFDKNDFSAFEEAMETCCKVGVLSQENRLVRRRDRHRNVTQPMISYVFFPHKLFQEYIAGVYLAYLFESDHESYEEKVSCLFQGNQEEFRYLLYFTASQTKKVGFDIINRLIDKKGNSWSNTNILVDVTFEAYDEEAARMVGHQIFAQQKSLEISDHMSAHTVSGYLFVMEMKAMETLILRRSSCGPTVSRELADIICSSTSLTALAISGTKLHADFYGILEDEIKESKLKLLSIEKMDTPDEVQSRNLARFMNNLPALKDLTLLANKFHECFYTELAQGTGSAEIERISLLGLDLADEVGSYHLAMFLGKLLGLKDLMLRGNNFHKGFYREIALVTDAKEAQGWRTSVCKLDIDDQFYNEILQDGITVHRLFPNLRELLFATLQTVSPEIVGALAHSSLKKLFFVKDDPLRDDKVEEYHPSLVGDSPSLEQVFIHSFPRLTDLTFSNLVIGNSRCETILLSLKQHQHLNEIRVMHCYTDEEIDSLASAINMEKRMNVELHHDQGQKCLKCCQMSSGLADTLCHRTSVQELILTQNTKFDNAWFAEKKGISADSKIQRLTLEGLNLKTNDPSASRDLARFLCLQPCLTDLTIDSYDHNGYNSRVCLHDEFYHEIARLASSSKIQKATLQGLNLLKSNDPSASRDLARFLCLQPDLTDVTIRGYHYEDYDRSCDLRVCLHNDFYHEIARLASSSKIQQLTLNGLDLRSSNDPSASRDLANFLCLQPGLTDVEIKGYLDCSSKGDCDSRVFLHDEFYHEIARLAASSEIQMLTLQGLDLERNPSASRDLATFLCLQACLIDLNISYDGGVSSVCLHDEFYHEIARLALKSKIQKLNMEGLDLKSNDPSASRDLATFLCLQPCLTDLNISRHHGFEHVLRVWLHDEFYHELARLALSSKIKKLTLEGLDLKSNDPIASRDLANFLCLQPCLIDLNISSHAKCDDVWLHDEFYHGIARLASSSKIPKLTLKGLNLESSDATSSRDLATFLCLQPSLTDLNISFCGERLHEFYHEIARLASSTKIQKLTLEGLNLDRNDPSASRDLARFLCLQPCLTDLNIRSHYHNYGYNGNVYGGDIHALPARLHDEFYHEIARLPSSSKIQKLTLEGLNLESNDPSASRDLATFLCLQPCLTDLMITSYFDYEYGDVVRVWLHDEFYHEIARLASSSKTERVCIEGCDLEKNDPTASRDLARFLCLLPCLTGLRIKDFNERDLHISLPDEFYHELARLAPCLKIQHVCIEDFNLVKNDPTASRDLARFLCRLPCLTDLTLKDLGIPDRNLSLHDDFYHELARPASSSNMSKIHHVCIEGCDLKNNSPTASGDLARFLCLLTSLTDLTIKEPRRQVYRSLFLHYDFYHEIIRLVSAPKVNFFTNKLSSDLLKRMDFKQQREYIEQLIQPALSETPRSRQSTQGTSERPQVQEDNTTSVPSSSYRSEVPSTSVTGLQSVEKPEESSTTRKANLQPKGDNISSDSESDTMDEDKAASGKKQPKRRSQRLEDKAATKKNQPRKRSQRLEDESPDIAEGPPRKRKTKTNRRTPSP